MVKSNYYYTKELLHGLIKNIALIPTASSFYPSYLLDEINEDYPTLLEYLKDFLGDGRLVLKYELRCPDEAHTILRLSPDEITKYLNQDIYCSICGTENISFAESDLVPYFEIDPNYKKELQSLSKNTKKKIFHQVAAAHL